VQEQNRELKKLLGKFINSRGEYSGKTLETVAETRSPNNLFEGSNNSQRLSNWAIEKLKTIA